MVRSGPLDLDPDHRRVLDHARGALLVTGPPGSGKTVLLRERFARVVEGGADPTRVGLFVLDRRAARDAKEHLVQRLRRSVPELGVFTAHGFAYRVLGRRFRELGYREPPTVLAAPEQYAWVGQLLGDEPPAEWPAHRDLLGSRSFAQQVADFMLRAQERLLDPDAVESLVERSGRRDHLGVARFYRRYLDVLTKAGAVDFGGLLYQTVSLLDREVPPEEAFEHVLVDDYQDATHATEAILRALVPSSASTVVAADPSGHVFSYRGGTPEPLGRLHRTIGVRDRVELSRNHRLGPDVRALQALEESVAPEMPTAPRSIEARLFAHPGEEAEGVAHELLRWRVDEDVPWEDMAVIVRRYGHYVTVLRHALARHGIPFVVVAEAAAVAAEPANRPVIDLLRYVFQPHRRPELLEPLLTSPVGGLDPHQVRRLRRHALTRDGTLQDLVEGGGHGLPADLERPVARFADLIRRLPAVADDRGPDGAFFWLWSEWLPHAGELVADEDRGRDLDALTALGTVLARFVERRPHSTVEDYLETLDAAEFGPDPGTMSEARHPHAVRIVSAHRSHGLEVEVAMVVGCLEGEFPSLGNRYPVVDLGALVEPRTGSRRLADRLADERALFRLAISRARRRTVLFASHSTGSRHPRTPSRFISRLGIGWRSVTAEEEPPSASLRSMETALRRRLADRSLSAPVRLAALAALPGVGAAPAAWWGGREWTDPGIPLHEGTMRTSYSRLARVDNCALQYLYDVEMGLDPEETYQMWLGSVIHRIIDRVNSGDLPAEEDRVHAALDEAWRKDIFPNRAVEHRRYLDAKGMLSRWLNNEDPNPVLSERAFSFPIDGAELRGRIDAVFRMNNGHLRVVDYKTGRSAPTKQEAEEDLQLAAYYLALQRDPELRALGEVGYLQLAYIGIERQREGFLRREIPPRRIDAYEERAQARITELLGDIRSERFAPSPEADCTWCRFKTICPLWPEGRASV